MILRIIVSDRKGANHGDSSLAGGIAGLSDIETRRVFFFQTDGAISTNHIAALAQHLADPVLEIADAGPLTESRNQVWVAYKRGIVDNESDSLLRLCQVLGIEATGAKVATLFLSHDPGLLALVTERHFNSNIEELHTTEPDYDTLLPLGQYTQAKRFDLREWSDDLLIKLGRENGRNLDLAKMKRIQQIQTQTGAESVTDVLLEAMDARWSDHCYHTTWKSLGGLLEKLVSASEATQNPNIISMFSDNAGIWDFYDGQSLVIKGETHNGPSAISSYFGQLTKLGGVLRDILGAGLGADPIGSFEYTATGVPGTQAPIKARPDPLRVAQETIRAIKEYGNTFGVPMMWSRMCFHPSYRGKPFALGGSLGLIPNERALKGQPVSGDFLMLIGGLTGNDGIHGAAASSAGAVMDTTAVQIGSPLEEVKFNTAILDLRDGDCLRALTDVGGAGLNSAVGEIGDPCGVWMNAALVPLKTAGLPMWRILLSESQERMVLAVKPEKLVDARRILKRHEVRNTVIGTFTGAGRYTVIHDPAIDEAKLVSATNRMPLSGEVGIDVPYSLLSFSPESLASPHPLNRQVKETKWPNFSAEALREILPRLVSDVEIVDQTFADSQYDSSVQGRRTYGPYAGDRRSVRTGYWACAALPDKPYAAVFATAFNPWLFDENPTLALRQCFFDLIATMTVAGVRLVDIAFCDNFYTPHLSGDWAYSLVSMVDELASLVKRFGTPVISGKDSSAGSVATDEGVIHVPPGVFLTAIGKAESFDTLLRNDLTSVSSLIVMIGPTCASAAGSVAARICGLEANDVDDLSPEGFHAYVRVLEQADRTGWLSGITVGSGGIFGTLFERVISAGFSIELTDPAEGLWWLLAEHRGAALLEIEEQHVSLIPPELQPRVIGRVVGRTPSILVNGIELLTPEAVQSWNSAFAEALR